LFIGGILVLALGIGVGASCGTQDHDKPPVTQLAEPGDVIDQDLMVSLAQAKNFHHKAKVYTSDGNIPDAIASVRQILSLRFPTGAPEAEDVRHDARALLAKLLVSQGQLDEAMRTVDEGLASVQRESFFVANLYTVQGEIHEARAAQLDADKVRAAEERRAAIASYDRSIQINEALQKRLMEQR
jgi:predicted negative regulator of RcsB-dependent stress response